VLIAFGWNSEPESVIKCVAPIWPNAVPVYYETVVVETSAVVKAGYNANVNVYLDISDAKTSENSSNQCIAVFS